MFISSLRAFRRAREGWEVSRVDVGKAAQEDEMKGRREKREERRGSREERREKRDEVGW